MDVKDLGIISESKTRINVVPTTALPVLRM